jgi:energy-coupling factor transport system ATP-binding protein
LKHLCGCIEAGTSHGIVGGNGSGKSTLFSIIAGVLKPQLGRVRIAPQLSLGALPQNPKALFVRDTLLADLKEQDVEVTEAQVQAIAASMGLTELLSHHPYDLSGGEAQKAALAKLLLRDPDILLLDEPTKGLDALAKQELGALLDELAAQGHTLVLVTHDLAFAAAHTDVCSLMADGDLVATEPTRSFFADNEFYTTPTNRMTRHLVADCLSVDDLVGVLVGEPPR